MKRNMCQVYQSPGTLCAFIFAIGTPIDKAFSVCDHIELSEVAPLHYLDKTKNLQGTSRLPASIHYFQKRCFRTLDIYANCSHEQYKLACKYTNKPANTKYFTSIFTEETQINQKLVHSKYCHKS